MFSLRRKKNTKEEHKQQNEKDKKDAKYSMHEMKSLIEDLKKEKETLKKESSELRQVEEDLKKGEKDIMAEEEELKKSGEELRKTEEELLEKIKYNSFVHSENEEEQMAEGPVEAEGGKEKIIEAVKPGKFGRLKKGEKGGSQVKMENAVSEEEVRGISRRMETPLDHLFDLVTKKGKISIDKAAKTFHVKEQQVDEWARILEEHNLIEIHYPAMGKPTLRAKKKS